MIKNKMKFVKAKHYDSWKTKLKRRKFNLKVQNTTQLTVCELAYRSAFRICPSVFYTENYCHKNAHVCVCPRPLLYLTGHFKYILIDRLRQVNYTKSRSWVPTAPFISLLLPIYPIGIMVRTQFTSSDTEGKFLSIWEKFWSLFWIFLFVLYIITSPSTQNS